MNIADKIRKLLALAQSSNPNEAALAAAKAQELMMKHAIEEADLAGVPPESVEVAPLGATALGNLEHWHAILAQVMGRSFFCRTYLQQGRARDVYVVGRRSDREVLHATWLYLRGEIIRMADARWEMERGRAALHGLEGARLAGFGRKFKRAFCMGAATMVGERLNESMKRLAADTTGAAIVLASRMKEVDAKLAGSRLSKGRATPVLSSGYGAGQQAGRLLNLSRRAGASKRLNA